MFKRKMLIFLLALVLGILGGVLYLTQISSYREKMAAMHEQMIPVIAAAREINPYTTLTREDLKIVTLPRGSIPMEEVVTDERDIVGRTTLANLKAGEMVLKYKVSIDPAALGISFRLPVGYVAMAVPVNEVISAGGLIKPGDCVDVVHVERRGTGSHISRTLVSKVEVLALGTTTDRKEDSRSLDKSVPRTAVLRLTPQEAAKIAWAEETGPLVFTLRPARDTDIHHDKFPGFENAKRTEAASPEKDSEPVSRTVRDAAARGKTVSERGNWTIEIVTPEATEKIKVQR